MTWAMGHTKQAQQPGGRFILPETPVSKLIDQLTAHCTGQERQSAVAEADPRKPPSAGSCHSPSSALTKRKAHSSPSGNLTPSATRS